MTMGSTVGKMREFEGPNHHDGSLTSGHHHNFRMTTRIRMVLSAKTNYVNLTIKKIKVDQLETNKVVYLKTLRWTIGGCTVSKTSYSIHID